ncbi:MAG: ATP-dependent DNA helicase RecG [Candidatus Nomurabacteria bacterium]|jgi:ATP-dependent DNA helicase RecG|nr:ATP-dependent DNA helicase RecG [Candidatus Nomurabacteria bacterium]
MDLSSPIENIKGIGEKTAELLARGGVRTVGDLLYYLPRSYEDYQLAGRISDLKPGKVTVKAEVEKITTSRKRRNLAITEATIRDETGVARVVWFNQAYREKQFEAGQEYYFSGEFEFSYGRYQLMSPAAVLASEYDKAKEKYRPVYVARGNLKSQAIAKFVKNLKPYIADVPDMLPNYPGRAEALFRVHFPESAQDVLAGREYLAVEELYALMLAANLNRQENQKLKAEAVMYDLGALKNVIAELPFRLTNAQRRATWEIIQDLGQETPMNRLLQGDVGSGKTLVAALAAFVVGQAGFQAALMVPTEILAMQHAESLNKILGKHLRIALLTGSTKHKKEIKKHIESGDVDLVVGTHALLTDDTIFHKLNLAIIDEQHRFGVNQRQKLLAKAHEMPHLLAMTATPIPRSLQLTIFGDLAVSVLDELPAGRQEITTRIVSPNSVAQMWQAVDDEMNKKHQVYYICKMVEDGTELSSVKSEAKKIQEKFRRRKVEYLHGKMKSAEKEDVMQRFADQKIDILVSTTVVEVGVDVPNATVIVIADADKYGLSQLHQLRGRVGRGVAESYCYLVNSTSDAPTRRMREIERSTDGFYLAEADLKLRGPGEIYGSLQHGALDLRIASIADVRLVKKAQGLVKAFAKTGEDVVEYKELAEAVRKYQRLTTLN